MRRNRDEIQKEFDELSEWLINNSTLNPEWEKIAKRRNQLVIELEQIENPVELNTDEVKTKFIQTL